MNLFKQLESGRTFGPRRILPYGTCGIGLSSFAAGLPAPVFVPVDESTSHIDYQRFSAHVAKNHLDPPPRLPLRPDALTPYLQRPSAPSHLPPANPN